jgi:3-oxoacyl-[acyl-carrier-protein] synthase-3
MEGKEVFRFAVGSVIDVIRDAFEATGTSAEELDWFVPHQANKRIITRARKSSASPPRRW